MTADAAEVSHRVGDVLHRALEMLRKEGPFSVWCKMLALLGYRRVLLIERSLHHVAPAPPAPPAVTVDTLAETDLEEYLVFRPADDAREIRRRLREGHECFVARVEGRIVHSCWVFTGVARIGFLGRDLALAPDEIYVDESYTLPAFRGLAVAGARSAVMAERYRRRGYRRTLAIVFPESHPARRALEKIGGRPVATLGYVRLGPWRRDFSRPHPLVASAPGHSPTSGRA